MSLPRYPEYKDSSVAWIGEVPTHWHKYNLQDVAKNERYSFVDGPFGSDLKNEEYSDSGVPLIQLNNISIGLHNLDTLKFVPVQKANQLERHNAFPGDIVIAKMADPVARAAIVSIIYDQYLIVADCVRLTVDQLNWDVNFVQYWINSPSINAIAESLSGGITRIRINLGVLKKLPIFKIPLKEQQTIAAFLDRETSKIDALIAEQQRLVELLAEKRQSVISHAVTKGLNPNAKMKDSGIEWLGEVPEHWEVCAIKHIVETPVTDGPHETPNFPDDGIPFVSAEAVSSGKIDFSKIRGFISEADHLRYSEKYRPKRGDIYMVKSGATTGVTAIVETDIEFNIWSPLAVIRCGDKAFPNFVLNFMRSKNFQEAVTLNWSFGTQQNIGMGVIENLSVTVPPVEEQQKISTFLDSEIAKFDTLTAEANCAIALLQERRSALISAAVTGKIDVRKAA